MDPGVMKLSTIVNLYLSSMICGVSGTCRLGTYGQNCERNCSKNCASSVDKNVHCDRSSGRCSEGCVPGWHGDQCIQPCSKTCSNSTCNQQTGHCTLGCLDKYSGDYCETVTGRRQELENQTSLTWLTRNSEGIIIAVVAIGMVAIIIVIAVIARKRCIKRHPKMGSLEEMALQLVEHGGNGSSVSPDQSYTAAPTPRRGEVHVNNELHDAVLRGNLQRVKHILSEDNVDNDSTGMEGRTAVMLAAVWGHGAIFNAIMAGKPDVSMVDQNGNNILHLACLGGDLQIVIYILSQGIADINSRNQDGKTPVMWAASCGYKDIFFLLLYKYNADMSLEDNAGKSILHWACFGGNIEIVKHVLSLNIVHIDRKDQGGMTSAMVAAEKGQRHVLDFLTNEGADLSLKDSFNNDANQLAARSGLWDIKEDEPTSRHTVRPCAVM